MVDEEFHQKQSTLIDTNMPISCNISHHHHVTFILVITERRSLFLSFFCLQTTNSRRYSRMLLLLLQLVYIRDDNLAVVAAAAMNNSSKWHQHQVFKQTRTHNKIHKQTTKRHFIGNQHDLLLFKINKIESGRNIVDIFLFCFVCFTLQYQR